MKFMKKRILNQLINIDKVAYKEVNFKSKLLEWTQKNRVRMDFRQISQSKDETGSPVFEYVVVIEGIDGCKGKGYSKKESQQLASRDTLQRLRREPQFIDAIFAAKTQRTKMEEEPVQMVPDIEQQEDFIIEHKANTPVRFLKTKKHQSGRLLKRSQQMSSRWTTSRQRRKKRPARRLSPLLRLPPLPKVEKAKFGNP